VYELPPAAAADAGLEGMSVEVAGRRIGRVAAVNARPEGLVLLVDTGHAYRPVPARFLEQIELLGEVVRLTPEGEAALRASAEVEPRVQIADSPNLVRYVPRELERLVVPGEPVRRSHSPRWWIGGVLLAAGALGAVTGPVLTAENVGGSLRWLWLAAPAAILALGAWTLWSAIGRDSPERLSRGEKAADALTLILGVSPRTRKRG
jgi:hypothetical protein